MSALSQPHLTLIRLLAQQAVKAHLTAQAQTPPALAGSRSNHPVQNGDASL